MKKITTAIFGLLFILVLTSSVKSVFAVERLPLDDIKDETTSQSCTTQTYKIDADEDNTTHLTFGDTGGKVDIQFNDTDGTPPSNNDQNEVIVTAGAGYEIVNVQYEHEHYSNIGWTTVPGNNPTTTITLAGTDDDSRIDEVEVKLKTVCATPTTTVTITPTATPTVAPTDKPNTGGPGDGLSDGRSDGRSSCPECTKAPQTQVLGASTSNQAVLGASTMAGTGTFEQNLMNVYAIFGMLLLTAGYRSYAKEKKLN